ncbi:MAG: FAD-binding protein [Clostridium sp.]
MKQAAERLKQAVSAGIFLTDEPMSCHTTFRTGGPADIYIEPSSVEELKQVLDICREENLAYTIIGNGSNLLVGDGGYRGVLISFGKPFGQCDSRRSSGEDRCRCPAFRCGKAGAERVTDRL